MKKIFSTFFVLIALLAMTTGAAIAGSALELVSVSNNGAGPTFVFRVTGELSQEELQSGFVSVEGGEDLPLYCAQQDETTVVCHTSKKAGASAVVVGFGGARFWVDVPDETTERAPQFCYPVWSWDASTGFNWTEYGPLCQDAPAVLFDGAYFEDMPANFFFGYYIEFFDVDVSDECGPDSVPYTGPAYYTPACPF